MSLLLLSALLSACGGGKQTPEPQGDLSPAASGEKQQTEQQGSNSPTQGNKLLPEYQGDTPEPFKEKIPETAPPFPMEHIKNKIGGMQAVHVSTAEEFVQAIDSDTCILLAPGNYDLTEWVTQTYDGTLPDHVEMDWDFSLCVKDVHDLWIVAEKPEEQTAIVVTNAYIPVLRFMDCISIRLYGLTLGHDVEPGSCTGSVLQLDECTDTNLEWLDLYGCGTYGLESYGGNEFRMRYSKVHDCSVGGLYMVLCDDAMFYGCTFERCGEDTVLDSSGSILHFRRCTFRENTGPLFPQPGDYDHDSSFIFEEAEFGDAESKQLDNALVIVREAC